MASIMVLFMNFLTYAQSSNWKLTLNDVRVNRQREGSGDRPYFNIIYFRVKFAQPGSTVVEVHSREPHDWVSKREYNLGILRRGDHMSEGEQLTIPWWIANEEWRNVPMQSISSLIRRFPTEGNRVVDGVEIFGAMIVSIDNNNTPPHFVRDMLGKIANNLRPFFQRFENRSFALSTALALSSEATAESTISALQKQLLNATNVFGTSDAIDWTLGSTFNIDRITGVHIFLFPNLSDFATMDRNGVSGCGGAPTCFNWAALIAPPSEFRNREFIFSGEGAEYRVRANLIPTSCDFSNEIRNIRIKTRTGDDDLRGGSEAKVGLVLTSGRIVTVGVLNENRGLGSRSDFTQEFRMTEVVNVSDVSAIRIFFTPGSCIGCTGDNWDLAAIDFTYTGRTSTRRNLFSKQEVKRFTGESREHRLVLTCR